MSSNGNKGKSNDGIDLVTPLIEIGTEIFKMLLELTTMLVTWMFRKGGEYIQEKVFKRMPLKPINKKMLLSKKVSTIEATLGHSVNRKRPFSLSELDTRKHTGIIGSTGSGKSVLLTNLQEHALAKGQSIIFFDPKTSWESIRQFKALCERYNKKAYIISDFYDRADKFNPLLEGNHIDICERIMNALDWSETFYKNESQMALMKAINQLKKIQGEEITANKLIELLDKVPERKNISGLLSQLYSVACSEFGESIDATSANSLTFKQIRDEKACVYIGVSALGMGSAGNILNKLFFGGLLYHCKASYLNLNQEMAPISIFFDELSSTIHEGFIDLQNKCRGAKMELTYATQCPSDIDKLSENITAQVFENTNNLFIFNQMVPKHTEFLAKTCGTYSTIKKTFATDEGKRSDRGTERETEEFLVHANILRNLRVGQAIFLQRDPKRIDLINVRFQSPQLEVGKLKTAVAAPAF